MTTSIITWQEHFPPEQGEVTVCSIFLLALLTCCWECPVWACCHSGNIFIPEHWRDLINWAKLPCMALGGSLCCLQCQMWACLVLWHPPTGSLLPGDSLDLQWDWVSLCEEILHKSGTNTLRIAPIHPHSDFRESFLSTTLHTQFLVPISVHLEAVIASPAFLMQHPVNSFFLLSLLTIFIISTLAIQSDP